MSADATATAADSTAERSSRVQARLKAIYRKTVLPVEKRFRYDYFYESPFLSDCEFECKCDDATKQLLQQQLTTLTLSSGMTCTWVLCPRVVLYNSSGM